MRLHFQLLLVCAIVLFGESLIKNKLWAQNNQLWDKQGMVEKLIDNVRAEGFDGVSINTQGRKLIVFYENRIYQNEVAAIRDMLEVLRPTFVKYFDELVLVTKRRNIPILTTTIKLKDYEEYRMGQISLSQFVDSISVQNKILYKDLYSNESRIASGNYQLQLQLEPQLRLSLGAYPDAVLHQVNLLPSVNAFLWKGAQVKAQFIVPLWNEFIINEEKMIRPGLVVFNQMVKLPFNSYGVASIGYFSNYRYGLNLRAGKFFFNNDLLLQASAGYTGYASWPQRLLVVEPVRGWEYADPEYINYDVGLSYRWNRYDLNVALEAGRSLFFSKYVRFSMTRQFNRMHLGFFGYTSSVGRNFGFTLRLPLYPEKGLKHKIFTARPSPNFKYIYHATQNYVVPYDTGLNFEFLSQDLNPAYIKRLMYLDHLWD